uniref:Short-chain dehydrogenase/reductase 3 n=1 Tax=Culicoides sonorensis TaxID=179676 RepID=A0A336KJD4_CULSO
MDIQNKHPNHVSDRLNTLLNVIMECVVFLLTFNYEILAAIYRLIIPPELKDLRGEIVLITGTGHGIGKELAYLYNANGCKVICVDINEKNNAQTVKELNALRPDTAFHYKCDVSDRDAVLELAKKVKADVGDVTVLVNNAGIMPTHPIERHTPDEIRNTLNINVLAHLWMLEAFLPSMYAKKRGHIVALASIAGVVGLTNLVPYCATKFAVRGLMEALQVEIRELRPDCDINCTTVCPFMVKTGLCKKPKVRFPNLLDLLEPQEVAKQIILAHRKNLRELTLPRYLMYLNYLLRPFPYKCALAFKDFMDSGVESDLS